MPRIGRHRLIVGALLLLLTASVAGNLLLYRQGSRPLFAEHDRPLVERTVALFARSEPARAEEIRTASFPMVMGLADGVKCVELRRHDRLGYLLACYDRRDKLILEMEGVTG